MTIQECYELIGADYNDVRQRFGNDERVKKFFLMFSRDPSYGELTTAMAAGDVATVFRMAHTLKGVAANLGLTELGHTSSELCEATRGGEIPPGADKLYEDVRESYEKVMKAVDLLREEDAKG